jgi:hypothetical protein
LLNTPAPPPEPKTGSAAPARWRASNVALARLLKTAPPVTAMRPLPVQSVLPDALIVVLSIVFQSSPVMLMGPETLIVPPVVAPGPICPPA